MNKKAKLKKAAHILPIILLILLTLGVVLGTVFALTYWDFKGYQMLDGSNAFMQVKPSDCRKAEHGDVHIAYITDANYIYPTQVSVYSAIKNKCPQNTYHFHIITDNIAPEDAVKAFAPFAREDVHFEIVPQQKILDITFSIKHISSAALLKFMIPIALPNISRVIYMDSDTLVMKDLQELYNTDLGDNVMAAVPDIGMAIQHEYLKRIGYKDKYYFNAGLFVLNLDQMRAEDIPTRLNRFVRRTRGLIYMDQDAYNRVLEGRIKKLHYKYNCMPSFHLRSRSQLSFKDFLKHKLLGKDSIDSTFIRLNKDEFPFFYRKMFDDVVMFHYFGYAKPWGQPTKEKQVQLFLDVWRQYAANLSKEFGIHTQKIIFKLPPKKKTHTIKKPNRSR